MSRAERRVMVRRPHPGLSLSRQCRLLSIGRSWLYYTPRGSRRLPNVQLPGPSRHLRRHSPWHSAGPPPPVRETQVEPAEPDPARPPLAPRAVAGRRDPTLPPAYRLHRSEARVRYHHSLTECSLRSATRHELGSYGGISSRSGEALGPAEIHLPPSTDRCRAESFHQTSALEV